MNAESLPVVASVQWSCSTCGASGVLHLARSADVLGLFGRLKELHRQESPDCEGTPADGAQIETPEGAVVNDPREQRSSPRPHMRPRTSAMLAMALAGVAAAEPHASPTSVLRKATGANNVALRSAKGRRGRSWRPYGERHVDESFTRHDQAAVDHAEAKRRRRAEGRAKNRRRA